MPSAAQAAWGQCFDAAQARFGVSAKLLRAVAQVESSNNPQAINTSHYERTRSVDIGLMQINSSHLGWLKKRGINQSDLLKPCISIDVSAQLLQELFQKFGDSWEAVGAYNAACTQLKGSACRAARDTYIGKVRKAMNTKNKWPDMAKPPSVVRRQFASVTLEEPHRAANHIGAMSDIAPHPTQDTTGTH